MLSRHSYKRLENDVDPLAVVTHGGGRDRGGKGSRVGDLWRRLRGARDGGGVVVSAVLISSGSWPASIESLRESKSSRGETSSRTRGLIIAGETALKGSNNSVGFSDSHERSLLGEYFSLERERERCIDHARN